MKFLLNRTVGLLSLCQALLLTNNAVAFSLNAVVGGMLTHNPAFATLPLTAYVLGTALTTFPASLWMQLIGRRRGFMTGAALGCIGSAVCALAVAQSSFWLLCGGSFLIGSYNAFGQYYRFAAAEAVHFSQTSRAISVVLAGGLIGAFLGPESAKLTKNLLPVTFLASYLSLTALACVALALQAVVRFAPPISGDAAKVEARPLGAIMRQPTVVVAVMSAVIGYGVMNFLMTASPLAMIAHHHQYDATATVIEWHIVGMYGPSFFTGSLIRRFGVARIILTGTLILIGCVAVAVWGTEFANFWTSMFMLGIGWNFLYIGGTTLLTESYRSSERAKVQGLNDFLIFGTTAATSLASGALLHFIGWQSMTVWMLPFLLLALLGATWLARRSAVQHTPA